MNTNIEPGCLCLYLGSTIQECTPIARVPKGYVQFADCGALRFQLALREHGWELKYPVVEDVAGYSVEVKFVPEYLLTRIDGSEEVEQSKEREVLTV